MELKSERLLLRPLGMQDLESVHEYASDLENTKYMMYLPNASMEETVDFAKSERSLMHFIAYCDTENVGSYCVMEKLGMKRTAEYGGRKNRASEEERNEYRYELFTEI